MHSLYDSLKKKRISKDATAQIASYAYHSGAQMTILSKSDQHQGNGVDCGVYAIEFATSLAYGGNPEKESYNKKRLLEKVEDVIVNCTPYVAYYIFHQQIKGLKMHNATNAKNGKIESAKRCLLSRLKKKVISECFREPYIISLFVVTDINSKNDKYMLSLTLSSPVVTKCYTHLNNPAALTFCCHQA